MEAQEIQKNLSQAFGDVTIEFVSDNPDPYWVVPVEHLRDIALYLRDTKELLFDFLESISGVDTTENVFLVYHLFSYTHRHSCVVRVNFAYSKLDVPSLSDIWPAANWHEREQYDLFGFQFEGHPDHRRLLLPEDWVGHPLLKNYEYPEEYHGIDHYRPDPKEQFKALDELAAKAAAKVREQKARETPATDN
jgi:NADH-quinone oxidoreductase subunit C